MFEFIVVSSPASADCAAAIAASRAGALGVADLTFIADPAAALQRLTLLSEHSRGRWGALVDDGPLLAGILGAGPEELDTIIVSSTGTDGLAQLVAQVTGAGRRAYAIATSLDQAVAAHAAGAAAVIAKGNEAGGWIGDEGAFILLQRLVQALPIPVWAHGGIGLHTVAAAYAGGAAGALLDGQVLLARESTLPAADRAAISAMDGSETAVFGAELAARVRFYARPGMARLAALAEEELRLVGAAGAQSPGTEPGGGDPQGAWRETVRAAVGGGSLADGLLPLGQDACFAKPLAERFNTVSGILAALRGQIAEASRALATHGNPLRQDSPLAVANGTRYPIAQGPMTRVSDRAEFAAAVSEAGALPFLALALMRAPEVDTLLEQTRRLAGERSWGVGILGFVPAELRQEQLAVVKAHRPPYALIAGGRPDQAADLEAEGISTYLHVPSPGLLRLYLGDGARKFIFEGRECGGHVGPRSSFVLWESMLQVLIDELPKGVAPDDVQVLFAGGVHDARSAAMVAAAAAIAAERGIRVGVLIGTAYLFTREAVHAGAITETFQNAAVAASDTALVESGPGHATRCLDSPFVAFFESEKRRLRAEGVTGEPLRQRLEELNIGRLRIASKGIDRNLAHEADPSQPRMLELDTEAQWDQGMYMIGQVASMRHEVVTLADLHGDISSGSGELLADLPAPGEAEPVGPGVPPPADVAIVGISCILPGAHDSGSLWANILDKVDAVSEVPSDRWDASLMYDPDPSTPDRVNSRWGGFIAPVEFNPMAFGVPPRAIASIEPFQLLALITAQNALIDAGYGNRPFGRERTSVILGAGGGGADKAVGYTVRSMLPSLLGRNHPELERELNDRLPEWTEDSFAGLLMNVAAGRIANRLDLGGTNYTVDAACASSLAAIGLAVRELQAGTSDMVLAGGVDAIQNPFSYLCFAKTRALSPRGRCRPLDASADGIAISEGFATVVLKRREDAERDGDRIYAIIRGVGASSDGRDKSLTAPRPEGQMRALRRAYAQARFSPASVGLIELHGTGTVAGDSAEIKSLSQIFAEAEAETQTVAVGSIKSMIGHTKAAAGVSGLIKVALALHHRVLPPTIGVTEPNPKANFASSPFYISSEARPWLTGGADHPRRAGVSAFGFGGTNFHIVLEEYTDAYVPDPVATVQRWPAELLLWRGTSEEIATSVRGIADQLKAGAEPDLASLALTLALEAPAPAPGLATLAVVAESLDDLRLKLEKVSRMLAGGETRHHTPQGVHYAAQPLAPAGAVAFLFPGQGSQAVNMARELTLAFPAAREPFELADRVLADAYPQPLSRYIFPPPTFTEEDGRRRDAELTDTHVAQAALGATELAYLRVLAGLGVRPGMTAGHSYGELVAVAAAGGLEDAPLLLLSEARGRLMSEAAGEEAGTMAAIDSDPEALAPLLASDPALVIANLNAPTQTVVSGPRESVQAAVAWCAERDLRARALPVACAFHSPLVAGAERRFAAELKRTEIAAPDVPVFSNTTGEAHAKDPKKIAQVLGRHLAKPVQFVSEIEAMHDAGARLFVEVGPRAALTGLADQILRDREHLAVSVDRPGRGGLLQLLHCLAALASEGVPVAPERLLAGRGAERLNLRRLARPGETLAPGTWLIDGGRAWPAGETAPVLTPVPPLAAPVPAAPPAAVLAPAAPIQPRPVAPVQPRPVAIPGAAGSPALSPVSNRSEEQTPVSSHTNGHHAPPGGDRVADVMARYQQLMQQFLETERAVMLGYLGAAGAGSGAVPARPSLPAPARALSAPAPLPAPAPPPPVPAAPPAAAVPAPAAPVAPAPPTPELVSPAQPAPTLPAAANGSAVMTRGEIEAKLLVVVSDRTGYPTEMLELDADLEGDLGIDSIKRVEVAGSFTADLGEEVRAGIDMEELTGSRTLREVIDVLERGLHGASTEAVAAVPFDPRPADTERIGRFVVGIASAPAIVTHAGLAERGGTVIIDNGSELGFALADRLGPAVVVSGADAPRDEAEAAELIRVLAGEEGGIRALVHLAGDDPYGGLEPLFLLAKAAAPHLLEAARSGGAAILGVTRQSGTRTAPAGFLKSLALEWPEVRVKTVHVHDGSEREVVAGLLAELHAGDGLVEVGLRGRARVKASLTAAPRAELPETAPLAPGSVVLLTGGARGITAEVAVALAERYRPQLVLVGRTELQEEPAATAGLAGPAELRGAMIAARKQAGEPLAPALVEADVRAILRIREARGYIARMQEAGATVEYLSCDVADAAAFGALIDGVYARHGRLDGVIHGAGVIEDRLVTDKTLESLRRVVAAKAGSARTLAERLRPDGLRFLVLFSSVSGRFGNKGQSDYAAASEALAGLARELDAAWPTRVVAIDWGPWSGVGMASALEDEFIRRGVALIDVPTGTRMLVEELAAGAAGEAEVVIGAAKGLTVESPSESSAGAAGGGPQAAPAGDPQELPLIRGARVTATSGEIVVERALSVAHDRYLDSHRVDGQPVLPFTGAMELMAEAATLAGGGRRLTCLDGIRLLKGVMVPDDEEVPVRISARPAGGAVEVMIAGQRPHYRALAHFAASAAGAEPPDALPELAPFPLTAAEAYQELLFHGPIFQGIAGIAGLDERGASALLSPSEPGACVAGAEGLCWLLDPVLLDCALQVQLLWTRRQWDVTVLPTEIERYDRFDMPARGEPVRLELRIRGESANPMCRADHWFIGADGRVLASLTNVLGVGTRSLNRLARAEA